MQISLNPLPTPTGLHTLTAIRDVSEYRRIQQALEQATTELEQQVAARNAELLQANAELRQQIAERAQAEATLRETEAQYRQLVENQPDLICQFLPDTTLTFVNAAYARFFGRQPEELLGQRFIEFLGAEEQAEVREQLAAFTPAAPARQYEHKTIRADGVARWHLWHDFAFFDEQGNVTGFQSVGVDITERKRAEEALRAQERRFRALIENSADAIALFDPEGTVLYASPGTKAILGYESAEVVDHLAFEFIHPDWQDPLRDRVAESLRHPKAQISACAQALHKDGSQRYLEGTLTNLLDNPTVGAIVVNYRDSTERKRAEEELHNAHMLLRGVINSTQDLIFVKDTDFTYLACNTAFTKFIGCPEEEIVGHDDTEWFPDQKAVDYFRDWDQKVLAEDQSQRIEEWVTYPDGSQVLLETLKSPYVSHDGRMLGLIGVSRDITERKRVEEALFEAKERAQVTLHSIGDAVITTDGHALVDYLNQVAEALTGWTNAEAQGRPLSDVFRIVNEQTRQPAPDPVARCLQEGKIVGLANHTVLINRHGQEYHVDDSAAPIRGRDGRVLGVVLVFHDVTENRRLTRQLEYDATHDALTGLINRTEFERRLERALASAQQYGARHALCYLDLDQFKVVNDTAGHAAGDELLRQINTILAGMFRERDTLARIGGDEFGLLLDNCPLDRAQFIAQTVVGNIRDHRFHWAGRTYQIGVSIGLVPITAGAQDTAQLLTQADVACYTAKELGRNRVHSYQWEDSETTLRHSEILGAAGLRDSLEQGRFRLHYQPIVPLTAPDQRPTRYEVLLRVAYKSSPEETSELVLPAAFIPAAERYGLMGAIDRWVIRTALREYANGIGQTGARIAINLSGNSLSDETLLDFIEAQFTEHAFPPEQVCFEITETAAIQNLHQATELMAALKRRGSQFALDDFGSGLSSFHYLKSLPVDYLKIDGSFVKDMIENTSDGALVAAINQMSHTLGIQTIAEYVHSRAIVERLRELGVDYAQGFFFGHPTPWGQSS